MRLRSLAKCLGAQRFDRFFRPSPVFSITVSLRSSVENRPLRHRLYIYRLQIIRLGFVLGLIFYSAQSAYVAQNGSSLTKVNLAQTKTKAHYKLTKQLYSVYSRPPVVLFTDGSSHTFYFTKRIKHSVLHSTNMSFQPASVPSSIW